MKLGIIGGGFVGKATHILKCDKINIIVYDILPELCNPVGTTLEDLAHCDLIFISVPTPMNRDGSCHLGILQSVIQDLTKLMDLDNNCVVIRSTVPAGTSDKLNCYFMPEFLTEKHFEQDFINNERWIFGIKGTEQDEKFKQLITELFNSSKDAGKIKSNLMTFMSNSEAEMVKLFRNTFLATKIAFCNEIYEFCQRKGINYEMVREYGTIDTRIGPSHSNVPGHDGKLGYGGTCFPKDINNLCNEMKENDMRSYILSAVIERNEQHDRVEHDWEQNKGRAVI